MPPPNPTTHPSTLLHDPHSRKIFTQSASSSSAYARHLQAASAYVHYYGGSVPAPEKFRNERDILEENHQFIRDDDDDVEEGGEGGGSEERVLARRYYDKLFKEFAVVELGRWRARQIAIRWRTKSEVLSGKGQFTCANLSCHNKRSTLDINPSELVHTSADTDIDPEETKGLKGFELNFSYVEQGKNKNALVKVRVCEECTEKLRFVRGEDEGKKSRDRHKNKDRDRDERRRGGRESRSRSGSRGKGRGEGEGDGYRDRDGYRRRGGKKRDDGGGGDGSYGKDGKKNGSDNDGNEKRRKHTTHRRSRSPSRSRTRGGDSERHHRNRSRD
ncbi:hypothetical protein RUND412_002014 [Rhizina undulata]